jgi:hypothetical protein
MAMTNEYVMAIPFNLEYSPADDPLIKKIRFRVRRYDKL